jgi:type I restriction enzyme S subunit
MLKYDYHNYPSDWAVYSLKDVADFLDGQRVPIEATERKARHGEIPYYGASGIIDFIDDFIFDDELVLLAEDGANILDRSTAIAFRVTGKCWVNNHAHVLKPKNNVDIDYLTAYLESLSYEKYNTGSAQPKLNRKVCEKIPVLLPPYKEQRQVAEILRLLDQEIHTVEDLSKLLKKQKQGLIQKLLTGEWRVPVEAEVAA